ncbi:CapA family protein [Actinophytocola sp.]|uniref:CapA family protein n=1 Tax=Actinophytocola sp. TaxID=1872138 RepID=UPI002D81039F|nr:CapA family protein [Actinophytocola sp.]HET9142750.1 CapA family protein [Actinophytocola sp.]
MRGSLPRLFTLLLVAVVSAGCAAQPTTGFEPVALPRAAAPSAPAARNPGEVVLAIAGDVHFAERTTSLLNHPETAFGPVSEVFRAADIAVVNLETAVTTRGTAEPKKYLFRAPPAAYDAVKAAGVDLVSQGNNHALDYGRVGLADSLAAARAAGVPVIGAGPDADAAFAPWITEAGGTRIAFLAISQVHELEASWQATDTRAGVAHARDRDRAVAAVRNARKQADVVVVIMHWGKEGSDCPTAEMRSLAGALAGAGADLITGTHAHLLLGDGWLGRTYVAYGLGNFLWWWNDAYSNDTGVLRVTLRDSKIAKTELVPAYISRETGQPIPVAGAEAERITAKFAGLRACTGLADAPS